LNLFFGIKVSCNVRYHSREIRNLMIFISRYLTFSGGHFYWGGSLLKGNGGVQRFSQTVWKLVVECKDIRKLDCKTYKSSRDESRS
jgi:hypothetical protein